MCGINVIIDFESLSDHYNLDDLKLMLHKTHHRGPDYSGIFHFNNVYLGHNRLSIIDLSSDSNQPYESDEYVIVFNGEIYNYLNLKRSLEEEGISFKTQGDTEVLLKAFIFYGLDVLPMLDGMFAFVILDKVRSQIFCARDRFGIKPLYYCKEGNRLFLSSEIKAIHPFISKPKLNNDELDDFLLFGKSDSSKFCFLQDVFKIEPGQYATISPFDYQDIQFGFYPSISKTTLSFEDALLSSVKSHLVSDVSTAFTLSGGLDSSSLIYGSDRISQSRSPLNSFTLYNKSFPSSDFIYVKKIAENLNLKENYVVPGSLDENCIYNELSNLVWQMDEPFGGLSIFYQHKVFQAIGSKRFKVAISGQGADEFLFGYNKYLMAIIIDIFKKNSFLDSLDMIRKIRKNNESVGYIHIIKILLILLIPKVIKYVYLKSIRKFLKIDLPRRNYFDAFREASFQGLNALRDFEILNNMQALLRFEDRNSMAHSIESRVPFISNNVYDCVNQMETELFYAKGFLKAPIRGLSFLPLFIKERRSKLGYDFEKGGLKLPMTKMLDDIKSSEILKSRLRNTNLKNCPKELFFRLWCVSKWESFYINKN
jgi:asparagine synthase (glutamine-hydrolysing)